MVESQHLNIVWSWDSMLVLLHGISGVRAVLPELWVAYIVRSHLFRLMAGLWKTRLRKIRRWKASLWEIHSTYDEAWLNADVSHRTQPVYGLRFHTQYTKTPRREGEGRRGSCSPIRRDSVGWAVIECPASPLYLPAVSANPTFQDDGLLDTAVSSILKAPFSSATTILIVVNFSPPIWVRYNAIYKRKFYF